MGCCRILADALLQHRAACPADSCAFTTQTPVAADAGTPSADGTPVGTEQAAAGSEATPVIQAGFGKISGSIENKAGSGYPADLVVTLHGFDHGSTDPSAGPQEILTQDGTLNADGTYTFENIGMPEGRIFLVEAFYSGVSLQSEMGIVEAGQNALAISPIALYELTTGYYLCPGNRSTAHVGSNKR